MSHEHDRDEQFFERGELVIYIADRVVENDIVCIRTPELTMEYPVLFLSKTCKTSWLLSKEAAWAEGESLGFHTSCLSRTPGHSGRLLCVMWHSDLVFLSYFLTL